MSLDKRWIAPVDGGPAFPVPLNAFKLGMTLRDYFAGQAIHAPWGEAVTPEVSSTGIVTPEAVAALAANCYTIADAMLAERAK